MGARRHPDRDIDADFDEHAMVVTGAEHEAAGVKAVLVSLQRGLQSMGAVRTAAALARLNQRHGFDCPGCAWPEEHGGRKLAEFCENGAKAVAEEATKRVVTPEFFARHSIADIEAFGLSDGDRVDLVSEFTNLDGELQERRAKDFMVVAYSTPRGNAAAYYPETNPLVALDHVAKKSNTPVSKAIVIRLEPA